MLSFTTMPQQRPNAQRVCAAAVACAIASISVAVWTAIAHAAPERHRRTIALPWPAEMPCAAGIVRVSSVDSEEVDAVYSGGRVELSAPLQAPLASAEVRLVLDCPQHEAALSWECKARSCSLLASYKNDPPWWIAPELSWEPEPEAVLALAAGRRPAKDEALIAIASAYAVTSSKLIDVACPEGRCSGIVKSCRAPLAALAKSLPGEWSLGQVRAAKVKLSRGGSVGSGGEATLKTRADREASIVLACRHVEESENPVACALRIRRGACRWSHLIDPQHSTQSAEVPGGWLMWSPEGIWIDEAALKTATP